MSDRLTILQGDCVERLRELPAASVHCCVTSPPYWGLRDYGVAGQLGLEKTPAEYVAKMVAVFEEVRRVLRDDGTLWVNMGDSYAGGGNNRGNNSPLNSKQASNRGATGQCSEHAKNIQNIDGLKPKDLCGIPWRLAFALQAAGWYLRSDIIWHKPNPMPESVTDRPTKSHEYIFLLAKSQTYFYDAEAIKEQSSENTHPKIPGNVRPPKGARAYAEGDHRQRTKAGLLAYSQRKQAESGSGIKNNDSFNEACTIALSARNKRTVWTVTTEPYSEAHFATFPTDLIKPCILAGTSAKGCCPHCGAPWERVVERTGGTIGKSWHDHSNDLVDGNSRIDYGSLASAGELPYKVETTGWEPSCDCGYVTLQPCTVLDPFAGSGTTGQVALELGRKAILIELNPRYVELIRKRCDVTPGLALA